ncbi:unnamed protein product [Clonostachys rosea f. rosea IK726]|uniref:Uncharacterized protein n=2 Tax=Bionectria ochroleuca TaxID=29856 RepID=A0A0B7KBF9_BIOOC|nr:unnamed protein product [Clonostachys rosea f. rosea IK726]
MKITCFVLIAGLFSSFAAAKPAKTTCTSTSRAPEYTQTCAPEGRVCKKFTECCSRYCKYGLPGASMGRCMPLN